MPSNDYQFVSHWRVEASCGEVADVIGDPLALVRWWPAVYLAVEEIAPARSDGTGRRVRLHTKGWLPYTLRWEFRTVAADYPRGYEVEAIGDLEGRGRWTFERDGEFVNVTYDWRVRARKPLLLHASSASREPRHRRVVHFEFAARELPAGLEWFGDYARAAS